MSDIQILAPAKVNLGLKVLPKRADGFHNIESIFQTVRLYDKLAVSVLPEKILVRFLRLVLTTFLQKIR